MTRSQPITKELFASGLQCAKRLYLDHHNPEAAPPPSLRRQALAEMGVKLTELAQAAFPQSKTADEDLDAAVAQTSEWLKELSHVAVFDAAFTCDGLEVRADIVIPDGKGHVDVYEVKSGTKVKPRHIRDLAFQVSAITSCGFDVRQVWVLHLNTQYRHKGGNNYPVHEIFKNVDVTDKVKSQLPRAAELISTFKKTAIDDAVLVHPMGTWCHRPFECPHISKCRASNKHPLLDLPGLTHDQESTLKGNGIENLTQLDPADEKLSPTQRRAVRAVEANELIVEPFVESELRDIAHPIHFVDVTSLLQVLPAIEGSRPWEHIPFLWTDVILEADGSSRTLNYVGDGKDDPRPEFVDSLADTVKDAGTVVVYGQSLEQRLRDLLEDLSEHKSAIRSILNHHRFDLKQLVQAGAYHPAFGGSFALAAVHDALTKKRKKKPSIGSDDEAQAACQRLLNSRTRAATRTKLAKDLAAYSEDSCNAVLSLFTSLISSPKDAAVS